MKPWGIFQKWSAAALAALFLLGGAAPASAESGDAEETFTVTWLDADGTVLEVDESVAAGATPSYDGATPTHAATPYYTFAFDGWTPEIAEVTADTTYTARYHAAVIPASDSVYDGMEIGARDPEAGLLHIAIMTDPHVSYFSEWAQKPQDEVFADCITDAKARGADQILVTGDLTTHSLEEQYQLYHDTVAAAAGDTEVIESIGNHELRYTTSGVSNRRRELRDSLGPRWRNSMGTGLYFSQWIGNTHIVALGCDTYETDVEGNGQLRLLCPTETQVDWFERIVEEDYRNGVTTVVMCHQPIKDTSQGSTEYWSNPALEDRVKDIILSHDNVILFSGHTHAGGSKNYIYRGGPDSGVFMHAGRIYQTSNEPVYVMMDEIETGDAGRSYALSYVFTTKVVPIYTFTHTGPKYTVTWLNADGAVLEVDASVVSGTLPSYDGAAPKKKPDASYTYAFAGWDSELSAVNGDVTYTAVYAATERSAPGAARVDDQYVNDAEELVADYLTAAASAGKTVTLLEDVTVESGSAAELDASAVLDLNGRTLTVEGSLYAAGRIVDSTGGGSLVLMNSDYSLSNQDARVIGLKDPEAAEALNAAAVYRFYDFEMKTYAPKQEVQAGSPTDTATFWFRLDFPDSEAYGLLSGGWDAAGIQMSILVESSRIRGGSLSVPLTEDYLRRYAAQAEAHPEKANLCIGLKVKSLRLLNGATLTVTPVLQRGSAAPERWPAASFTYSGT